eukprot:4091529-Pleurochrysis_carterae.AAC.1
MVQQQGTESGAAGNQGKQTRAGAVQQREEASGEASVSLVGSGAWHNVELGAALALGVGRRSRRLLVHGRFGCAKQLRLKAA